MIAPCDRNTIHFAHVGSGRGHVEFAADVRQSLTKTWCTVCPGIDSVTAEESKKSVLPRGASWTVHKFGGTCVGTSERIKDVAEIIVADLSVRKVAVVSAMFKVTDMMYDLLRRAQARDESYNAALDKVYENHKETAMTLLEDGEDLVKFLSVLEADIKNLRAMLRAICIGIQCALNLAKICDIHFLVADGLSYYSMCHCTRSYPMNVGFLFEHDLVYEFTPLCELL